VLQNIPPGYDEIYQDAERGVTEVACMAQARRKYFEAQSLDIMRPMVVLACIQLLYDVEREARDGELGAERLALRQARSRPLLQDLRAYLERERRQVLPKSPIAQAIDYTLSNWDALVRYAEDGDLGIDNNGAERSLRGVAVGRRNWTFLGSYNGGRTAAVLSSLIATYLEAASHRSVRLPARRVRADQRPPQEAARGIASRQMTSHPDSGWLLTRFFACVALARTPVHGFAGRIPPDYRLCPILCPPRAYIGCDLSERRLP
jgi:hypothetical protein